ncbi:MAG TPA: SDR family oxidoreductase, partial [Gemmatimonadales bacterium]|nr:SDR family oxidoreductase [Gemmatimonadales bacterium]
FGWPAPDNTPLTRLTDLQGAIAYHVAEPLAECISLAGILRQHGAPGATLVLVGSTASLPGRHAYRKPLYSLAKGMIPTLTAALAVELGGSEHRCTGVIFDALDGGMNAGMSPTARVAHADRSPFGLVPTMEDAARQVLWLLDNPGPMASGSVMILSGGALP